MVFIQKQPTFRFNKKMRQKKNDVRFEALASAQESARFHNSATPHGRAVRCAQGVAGLGANGAMASPKEESWGDAKGALEAMPSCKECQYQLGENNPAKAKELLLWVLSTRERYTRKNTPKLAILGFRYLTGTFFLRGVSMATQMEAEV